MRNFRNSNVYKRLKRKYASFLLHEATLPPAFYFLIFAYTHFPLEPIPPSFGIFLFGIAVKILMISNFNFLFMIAPFFNTNPIIAILMAVVTLLSSNQKWKVYMLIFAVGDNAFGEGSADNYFLAFFSAYICYITYHDLIFRTIQENERYFMGFTATSTYFSLQIAEDYLSFKESNTIAVILVISAALLAKQLFRHRMRQMQNSRFSHNFQSRQMAHFIKIFQQDIEDSLNFEVRLKTHTTSCVNVKCFCRNKEFRDRPEYLIRSLYEIALEKPNLSKDCLLFENYIDFLLINRQIISALHFLSGWEVEDYFTFTAKSRSLAKVESYLKRENSSNIYENQYTYALQYDQHSLFVAVQINKILKLKLQFWNQINKECPRVVRLQKIGYEIIDRMYQLNIFYNYTIKTYEKKIFVFNSTVLYGMYMLSTTNFKEYAELIIKNTAKLLEQVYVFENGASETFVIRTAVKSKVRSFSDQPKVFLSEVKQQKHEGLHDQQGYKLIIDGVSLGLCKILHLQKRDILDQELISIIPNGYKEVHSARLNYLLDFDASLSSRQMSAPKVVHREIKLPIRGSNGELVMGYICIKFLVEPNVGLVFLSIVKLVRDKCSNILIDFSGNITEMEEGFNENVLMHSEMKKYLNRFRSNWTKEKMLIEQKFNLMINSANYIITINSPYLALFEDCSLPESPPIHIEVMNEETNKNRNIDNDRNNQVGRQIKHMENALNRYDASESTSSSKGGTSAVNILTLFSENNTVQLYRFLYITYVAIITCCIFSNFGAYLVNDLPWDTTVPTNNPINDTMNFNALKMLTIKGLITLNDEITYFHEPKLNKTRIYQYFGFQNYTSSVIEFITEVESAYKDSFYNILGTSSDFLSTQIDNQFFLPVNLSSTVDNGTDTYQGTSYQDLVTLYTTDFNLMTQLQLDETILQQTYSPTIARIQNVSFFSDVIDSGVAQTQQTSILVHIALIVFSIFLLIPLFCLLRNRLSLHQKIFDLLVSISPDEVENEINSLEYISNILRNYKQSDEIMKTNVLGYEENVIHPKVKGSRSSLDNEMILGLEKYDPHKYDGETERAMQEGQSAANSEKSFKITSSIRKRESRQRKLSGLIKSSFITTKQESSKIKRKRAGQLDLEGSILDPNQAVIPSHCIVYSISISFLAFLIVSILLNLNYNTQYLTLKNHLFKIYNEQILFEQYLLTIKVYLVDGGQSIQQIFNVKNELEILLPDLNEIPTYSYYDGDVFYSNIIQNCTNSSVVPNTFLQKYCQLNYSEIVLKGEFGTLFKELTQVRYAYDHGLPLSQSPDQTLINIKEKFYYLESINIRLQQLVLDKINMVFEATMDLSTSYENTKLFLLVLSVIWGLLCFLIGLAIQIRMKEGYFKEVFLITLLNNEMILTNKRVESFLESIARSSYS